MSFAKKLIAAGSIFAMAAALAPTAFAQSVSGSTTGSSSSTTVQFCYSDSANTVFRPNGTSPYKVSEIASTSTTPTYFVYAVTKKVLEANTTGTPANALNYAVCDSTTAANFQFVAVPVYAGKTTNFKVSDSLAIDTLEISNKALSTADLSVTCDGEKTKVVIDPSEEGDKINTNAVIFGATDFTNTAIVYTPTTGNADKAEVTFTKKSGFTGTNDITVQVTEAPAGTGSFGAVSTAIPTVAPTAGKTPTINVSSSSYDFKITLSANCSTASSSSSSSMSSKSSMSSTSMSSETMSSKSSMTSKAGTAGNDNDPKGNTPRTGGF
jgi:hypothetical protein